MGKRTPNKKNSRQAARRRGKAKNNRVKKKAVARRTDLKSVLQSIYHDHINLETTCSHRCECCKVAMPQINYSEFVQIATKTWERPKEEILGLINASIEYFFRYEYEKWGKDSLVKPCMFLQEDLMCSIYEDRPLSCRLYGLWPKEMYEDRVDKFEKAYEEFGLTREDLPLNTQCPYVKRKDDSEPITKEIIEGLYKKLDDLDKVIGTFSDVQTRQKENYRTFHDWLLLKIFGEDWLSKLTAFILAADREIMENQIQAIKDVVAQKFGDKIPDITSIL